MGALVMMLSVVLAVGGRQLIPGALLALLGVGLCAGAVVKYLFDVAGRVFVEIYDQGFIVRDNQGELEYREADVQALATACRPVYGNGMITAIRREATLQIDEGSAVQMNYTFPLGDNTDPLAGLFNRLEARLLAHYRELIASGRQAIGDGWRLDEKGLIVETGEAAGRYPYSDLATVNIVDHKVKIWERGVAEATIEVPLKAMNAWALMQLLNDHLAQQGGTAEEDVGEGLGRVIFERDKSWSVAGMFTAYISGVALVLVGIPAAVVCALGREPGLIFVGLGMVALGFGLVAASFFNRINIFRAHSLGVMRKTALSEKQLRYDEVATFTWAATRQFVNGAYTGTTMNLAFLPEPGLGAPSITYGTTLKGQDEELDNLRDFISRIMAGRWLQALQRGHAVAWTAKSTFLPEGLIHGKGGYDSDANPIPYNSLLRWSIDNGWLSVFGVASKPLVQEQINQPNFFPGFTLLLLVIGQGGVAQQQPGGETPRASVQPAPRRARRVTEDEDDVTQKVKRVPGSSPEASRD
jgi:hypothetical protein